MSQPFLGEIRLFPYNFAPRNWAFCNGSLLSIAQQTALFSLLGTTYGGDGVTTFALPDLRGRRAIGSGQGPGLQFYDLGQVDGVESVTLVPNQAPVHNHTIFGTSQDAIGKSPAGGLMAATASPIYNNTAPPGPTMNGQALSTAGGGLPHENRAPFLTLNYCIAMEGIFPSRN